MKACHMTSAHSSLDGRIFYKECVSLARAGYDTYLVAPGDSFDRDGVHIIGTGTKSPTRLKRMMQDAKRVYEASRVLDADIYHLHDPELLPYALKLKKLGKRVIFDSHENYSMQIREKGYIPNAIRKIIAAGYYAYETYVLKRIDAVVVPCTFQGENIFEHRARNSVLIANYSLNSEFYDKYTDDKPKEPYDELSSQVRHFVL